MRCSALIHALLFTSVVDATTLEASALAVDDECLADGEVACALNALQLRGQAKQAAVELTAAEAAAAAADLVAEAAESSRLAAEVTQALSLELGNAKADDEPDDEVHAGGNEADDEPDGDEPSAPEVRARGARGGSEADDEAGDDADGDAAGAAAEVIDGEERALAMDEIPMEVVQEEANRADTYPDISTGEDAEGPYLEAPSEEQDRNPAQANMSLLLQVKSGENWYTGSDSFCSSHHTGSFCQDTTQIRCCRKDYGYVKCGSTWHSSSCGWNGGGGNFDDRRRYSYYDSRRRFYESRRRMYYGGGGFGGGGGGWHVHPGWHQSSFCTSHHIGTFCSNHRKIHCCNDYGHFVDCTTRQESSYTC